MLETMGLETKQILIEGMPPITLIRGRKAPIEERVRMVTGYFLDDFVYELENNPKYKGVIQEHVDKDPEWPVLQSGTG